MPAEAMSPEEYATIDQHWEMYYHSKLKIIHGGDLKQITKQIVLRAGDEDDPDTLDANLISALTIFCTTEKHTKNWWEWMTIINGSLKARYVCMCITDEDYWEKQKERFSVIPKVKTCNTQRQKKRSRVMTKAATV